MNSPLPKKETFTKAQDLWTNDLLTKLFVLDSSLNCKIVSSSFKQIIENDNHKNHNKHKKNSGVHSEIEAQAKITCEKVIKDQSIAIALKKHYPLMKKILILEKGLGDSLRFGCILRSLGLIFIGLLRTRMID